MTHLHIVHVNGINVRTFFPIDLDRDKGFVQDVSNVWRLEALSFHDMAPLFSVSISADLVRRSSSACVQWQAAYPILRKRRRLCFLARSSASGSHICQATGLFM